MERTSRRDARARVVGVLAETGAVSRADLARRAALAPSTVSAVVNDLHAAGLVVAPAASAHAPVRAPPAGRCSRPPGPARAPVRAPCGRPPVLIALHRSAGVVAGIDFGKRHLRMAISDLSHRLLAERHRELDVDLPAGEAIRLAKAVFDDALGQAAVDETELVGVGMGLPGPVHRPSGELGNSTILPGWVGVRAEDAVSAALGHRVLVENDANLGALGEWMW